jgi:DNA-binding transcriptional MocR family regulator
MSELVRYLKTARGASALAAAVEGALRDGRLRPGDPLPPVRALAAGLALSPATVAAAYRELGRRGVVAAAGRRGTRIAPRPPVAAPASGPRRTGDAVPAGLLDLASGSPDAALLPELGPFLATLGGRPRLYGAPTVLPDLAERAATWLDEEGIPAAALTVVGGAMDGVERALLAHCRPGDRVAVEDPGYPGVLDLLGALGLVPEPLELDDEGPLPASLAAALERRPAACVLTPRAQNPTGAALTPARARELRRLLARYPDCLAIEDDHAGPICGRPLHAVAPAAARWVHVRSLSKSLGPDLRVALLAGDAATVARVEGRRDLGTGWVSLLLQELAARLLADRGVARRLERAASEYAARRDALVGALAHHGVAARGTSGLNVWVPAVEEAGPIAELAARGWAVRAGERYRLRSPPGLRVTVSRLPASRAPRFAGDLAAALRPVRGPRVP